MNNKNFKLPKALVMVPLFLCLILMGVNAVSAADGDTIYVNGSSGSDAYNGFTPGTAKLTIQNATATVNTNGKVNIADGTYTGSGNRGIIITKNMAIIGQSQNGTVIDAEKQSRIFTVASGVNLIIQNLTLQNGTNDGGAIYNNGTLTVSGSNFNGNNADFGGAIYNIGSLSVSGSNFNGNNADFGGAIYNNDGSVTVINSTFTGNTASNGLGGAIFNWDNLDVSNSIFTNNTASSGGAISNTEDGILSVSGSTFTGNNASDGGAIYNDYGHSVTVSGSTFTGNNASSGGAIYNDGSLIDVHFNRIVGNTGDYAIYNLGSTDAGYNWWGSNSDPSSKVYGYVTVGPWLVLTVTADPDSVLVGGNSTVTVDLLHDSNGDSVSGYVPDGIHVTLTAVKGIISPESSTLINGVATSTFTASAAGTGSVTALVDGQSVPVSIVSLIPTNTTVDSVSGYPGQNVTLTADVTDSEGNLVTGGKVQFKVNGESVGGLVTVNDGEATLTWTIPDDWSAYDYEIRAEYQGVTGTYATSFGTGTLTVNLIPTSLTVNPASGYKGDKVNLTATLRDTIHNVAIEGKTVTFYVNGEYIGSGTTNSAGVATYEYTITQDVRTYVLGAIFSVDDQYEGASGTGTLTVNAIPTSLTVSPISGYKGDEINLTATLRDTAHNVAIEGKTVTFYVNGEYIGSGTTNSAGVATYTYNISENVGSYTIKAVFGEDTQYANVNGTGTLNVTATPTNITVDSVSDFAGQNVNLVAHVTAVNGNPVNEGKVRFTVNNTIAGTVDVHNGTATFTWTIPVNWSVSLYQILAEYLGTGNFTASNGTSNLNVTKTPTTTTVSPVSGYAGQNVTLKATVTSSVNEGQVKFMVNGVNAGTTVVKNGSATLNWKIPTTWKSTTYTVKADYLGSDTFAASNGTNSLTVTKTPTTTTVSPVGGYAGQNVTLKATVTGNVVNEGQVKFTVNGVNAGTTVVKNGSATLNWKIPTTWKPTTYTVKADYLGSDTFAASNGTSLLTVTKTPTSTSVSPVGGYAGQTVTLKATVTGNVVNEGQVKFTVNGVNAGTTVVKNGSATLNWKIPTTWKPNTYTVKADYLGTGNYNPSTGSLKGLTVKKPLAVLKSNPAKGKTNIPTNKALTITVTFSENIKKGTNFSKIMLKKGTTKVAINKPTLKGKILTIKTKNKLSEAKYTLTLPTSSVVKTSDGKALSAFSTNFITGTSPKISKINPKNKAKNVARSQVIKITFNKNIKAGSNYKNITLTDNKGKKVTIKKTIKNKVLTITHTKLKAKTKYTLKLTTKSITDKAGNPLTTKTTTFTTKKS